MSEKFKKEGVFFLNLYENISDRCMRSSWRVISELLILWTPKPQPFLENLEPQYPPPSPGAWNERWKVFLILYKVHLILFFQM